MILGIGSDITDIRRIEKSLQRFGARFEDRVFTEAEQKKARSRVNPAHTYAKRFAAKEACIKALASSWGQGIAWKDMEIVNQASGAPTLRLSGRALGRLQAITPKNMAAVIHVSLSDDYPYAQAFVIISAERALTPALSQRERGK